MAWYDSTKDLEHDVKKGVGGAAIGAATGAQVGSTFGPVGTVVGGIVGGVGGGILGANDKNFSTESIMKGLNNSLKPAAPKVDTSGIDAAIAAGAQPRAAVAQVAGGIGNALAEQRDRALNAPTPTLPQTQTVDRQQIQNVSAAPVNAASIAPVSAADQQAARLQQQALVSQLQARADGTAPSVAQLQLQKANEQAIAAQMAGAASARGGNPVLAQRQAAQNIAALQQGNANEAAMLRLNEQTQAQNQLGSTLAGLREQDIGLRGQDVGIATRQAELQQQAALTSADNKLRADLANQGVDLDALKTNVTQGNTMAVEQMKAQLTKLGYDAQTIANYMNNIQQQSQTQTQQQIAEMNNATALQGEQNKLVLGKLNTETELAKAKSSAGATQMGGLFQAAGSAAAAYFSDKRLKDVKKHNDSQAKLAEMLNKLNNHTYTYKFPERDGHGEKVSIMAQDLEKSELGKQAVIETPEGKMVNYNKLLPAMLSANVDANKRLKTIEEALTAKRSKK